MRRLPGGGQRCGTAARLLSRALCRMLQALRLLRLRQQSHAGWHPRLVPAMQSAATSCCLVTGVENPQNSPPTAATAMMWHVTVGRPIITTAMMWHQLNSASKRYKIT